MSSSLSTWGLTPRKPRAWGGRFDRGEGKGRTGPITSKPFVSSKVDLSRIAARIFLASLGLAAITWGAATLPVFWSQAVIERVAAQIIDRNAFRPGVLLPLLPTVASVEHSGTCRPEAMRSASIIRLRLTEDAMAAGAREEIDNRLTALNDTIRRSLACAPSDAFLWMLLAWLDGAREGFRPGQLRDLELSYRLGPNEGWIAARRNRLAVSMFQRLPPDLAEAATTEFARMVDSWIYWEALAIFTGPGWPIHDRLLASLSDVGRLQREAFAKQLYTEGYNVVVPGIEPRNPRPWY